MNKELIQRGEIHLQFRRSDPDTKQLIQDLLAALKQGGSGWQNIGTLDDKETVWLYTKDLGVFKGCKIGSGYYVNGSTSRGYYATEETVSGEDAELDPLLFWMPIQEMPLAPSEAAEA